jgi:hypothetical protein
MAKKYKAMLLAQPNISSRLVVKQSFSTQLSENPISNSIAFLHSHSNNPPNILSIIYRVFYA